MDNLIEWLQTIFADDLCGGTWEHRWGIQISTLDNPGWAFKFDLIDTDLVDIPFNTVNIEIDENNWFMCRIQDGKFEGAGGPKNLTEILRTFKEWYVKASQIAEERKGNTK